MKNFEFWLLGNADENNPLAITQEQILQWQHKGLITYLGSSFDVREHIAAANCIVLPSYREGIPRVLLEAMAMGKPIITTDAIGCKETIDSPQKNASFSIGKNGILCQKKSIESLKEALLYFGNLEEEQQEAMGKAGYEYVKKFDIKNIIKIYKDKIKPEFKKISFVSNTAFGMYNFRLDVLRALKNLGLEIHILSPYDNYTQKLIDEGFIHHRIKLDSKGLNPFKDLQTILEIKKILTSIRPDMSFNYTIKPVIYASMVTKILKIPTINVITGLGYVFAGESFKQKVLRFLVIRLYQIALKNTLEVWFLNSEDKKEFLNQNIIKESKAFLLQSEGVNLEHFHLQSKPKNDKIIFLLIARMLWDKGIGEFIEAIKAIKQKQ